MQSFKDQTNVVHMKQKVYKAIKKCIRNVIVLLFWTHNIIKL